MIPRDRPKPPPPVLDLNDPDSPAAKETKKAIDYAADPAHNPKPKFSVYSHDKVKTALINLFEGKCAYCESKVNAVAARDIEHYRPKGQIDPGSGEEIIKPGYYWLAANWDNLLLSCPACNRRQRQLQRLENGELEFEDEAHGKLDFFPLAPGTERAADPDDDLAIEEPGRLLLNPCLDKPEKYLRYDKEGHILPRRINGKPSAKAEISIKTYVLWRSPLVEDRKQRYLDMKRTWDTISLAAQMIDSLDDDQQSSIAELILLNEEKLRSYSATNRSFTGMARWLSRSYFRRLREIRTNFKARFGQTIEEAATRDE